MKKIAPSDPEPEDIDLDSDVFIMYGSTSHTSLGQALSSHRSSASFNRWEQYRNPYLTEHQFNPAKDVGGALPSTRLLRAHGVIMMVAWPLLAVTAIFLATWMKVYVPKGRWLQVCCVSTFKIQAH